jgi:hypothetical protein
MEAGGSAEISVSVYQSARRNIPRDSNLDYFGYEYLHSCSKTVLLFVEWLNLYKVVLMKYINSAGLKHIKHMPHWELSQIMKY